MFTAARVSSVVAVSAALICSAALPATAADTTTTVSVTAAVSGYFRSGKRKPWLCRARWDSYC
ncbi:putative transglutaminase-like cysteine proteinase [Arthrobacter sp. V4I6]|nr:putative transglutaminase-like cysteine proteinase [Arthrobacter sp. V4I6]